MTDHDFVGPAVVAEQDESRLCFPIRLPGRSRVVHQMADVEAAAVDGLVDDVVIPFNGVLRHPRAWSSGSAWSARSSSSGATTSSTSGAPAGPAPASPPSSPRASGTRRPTTSARRMMFGRTTYNHSPSDLKHYCMCRNNVANLKEYVGALGVLAFLVKTLWFYTFTRPTRAGCG